MIKCNSFKKILDEDSHYIESLHYELNGWLTISNLAGSNPSLFTSHDVEWINENLQKASIKHKFAIESVLNSYKSIPKNQPVQFYFDTGYVGWYDDTKNVDAFDPCPPHIGFNSSYASMYPNGGQTKNITIVITEDCPLACTYCYQANKNPTYMTKSRIHEIVDLLFHEDMNNSKLINPQISEALIIEFIGGEPLMSIDMMNEFMEYFLCTAVKLKHRWAIKYMISVSSNGVLYNSKNVQKFIETYKGRLSLNITIDGNKDLHDSCRRFKDGSPSYDIVERSVKQHLRINPYMSTKLTLSPDNIMYTFNAIKNLFTEVGVRVVFANCVFEDGWTYDHAKILYAQMKQLADWLIDNNLTNTYYCSLFSEFIGSPLPPSDNANYCGGSGAMLSFTADGGIQPCLRYCAFNLNNKQPELRIGSIQEGLLSTDEHCNVYNELSSITRRSQSTDECFNCPIASGCAWCSAHNYEQFGTANKRATAICPMHKARTLANYYYYNKLYRSRGSQDRSVVYMPIGMALDIIDKNEFAYLESMSRYDK